MDSSIHRRFAYGRWRGYLMDQLPAANAIDLRTALAVLYRAGLRHGLDRSLDNNSLAAMRRAEELLGELAHG